LFARIREMGKKEQRGSEKLKDFLFRQPPEQTLLVCDFDGTLYRGICPALGRGLSAADLGFLLCLSRSPLRALRIGTAMCRLLVLMVRLRYRYIRGRISMSRMDRILVHFFVRWVLRSVPPEDLERAARKISGLTYPCARACIREISSRIKAAAIVSKAFDPVLKAVAGRLSHLVPGNWITHGVHLVSHSPLEIDRDHSVLSRRDKYQRLQRLLDRFRDVRRVLVIGDTEDDIAMADSARERLGNDGVFLIAVHAKDPKIRRACDLDPGNWKRLHRMIRARKD